MLDVLSHRTSYHGKLRLRICAICGKPSNLCGAVMDTGRRPVMFVCFGCDDRHMTVVEGFLSWVTAGSRPTTPEARGRHAYNIRVARRALKQRLL